MSFKTKDIPIIKDQLSPYVLATGSCMVCSCCFVLVCFGEKAGVWDMIHRYAHAAHI